ncbi:MAG: hypothetical protein R3E96_00515 [Planctomycetota bacterium]
MSAKTKSQNLIVEDVISAIYAGSVEGGPTGNLNAQVKRVRVELGRRKATQFTRALLDSLSENPDELVRLEALVVLGFAHPDVMRKHQVPLHTEGRRLGVLLEKAGRPERAQEVFELLCSLEPENRTFEIELAGVMRRSGKASDLIERYMERADSLMTAGKGEQALPWLQEVLALDRNRRDVTMKIRDIRHGGQQAHGQTIEPPLPGGVCRARRSVRRPRLPRMECAAASSARSNWPIKTT